MFGTKKGGVAKAPVMGPQHGAKSAVGKNAKQHTGEVGKAASAGGKKVK